MGPDSRRPGYGHVRCPRAPCDSRDPAPPPDRPRCSEGLHEGPGRVSSGGQTPPLPAPGPHAPCQPTCTGCRECICRASRGPRRCPCRASICPCVLARWLFMMWRSWVVFVAGSSPRHPPRKEHLHVGGRMLDLRFPLTTRVLRTSDPILVRACCAFAAEETSRTTFTKVPVPGFYGCSRSTNENGDHPLLHDGFRRRPPPVTTQGITCRPFTRDGL